MVMSVDEQCKDHINGPTFMQEHELEWKKLRPVQEINYTHTLYRKPKYANKKHAV
jgi:hypothetical protein